MNERIGEFVHRGDRPIEAKALDLFRDGIQAFMRRPAERLGGSRENNRALSIRRTAPGRRSKAARRAE